MKLAISGTSSTGKTTLAKALAEKFSIEYIPESYDALFENNKTFSGPPKELAPCFEKVFETKIGLEKEADNFIVDRCTVDLFHLWQRKGLSSLGPRTRQFYQQCAKHMSEYDYVILLPWGSIPLEQLPDSKNQVRVMNPWVQLSNHASIVGFANMWVPKKKLITIPPKINTLEQRIEIISRIIAPN